MTAALPLPIPEDAPPTPATHWTIDVFVPGQPVTKGSTKAFMPKGGRFPVVKQDNSADQKAWVAHVRHEVLAAWDHPTHRGPHDTPFALDVEFVLPRRSGAPKSYTPEHTRKPDIDKLTRAIMDSLSKVVWVDDSRVIDSHEHKREAAPGETPGARIRIAILPTRRPR